MSAQPRRPAEGLSGTLDVGVAIRGEDPGELVITDPSLIERIARTARRVGTNPVQLVDLWISRALGVDE